VFFVVAAAFGIPSRVLRACILTLIGIATHRFLSKASRAHKKLNGVLNYSIWKCPYHAIRSVKVYYNLALNYSLISFLHDSIITQ
jgi:hypothetical protein